jgi:deoxyribodipyrimidine photo-lyase
MTQPALILFDSDLRIEDNPAFFYAMRDHKKSLPLFILDEKNKRELGAASKWFLHFALEALSKILKEKYQLNLALKKGDSLEILEEIFKKEKITAIYFNQLLEPYNIKLQSQIRKLAEKHSIAVFDFKSQTLFDPKEIKNGSGNYYKVFTPFWKECLRNSDAILNSYDAPKADKYDSVNINSDKLNLLPKKDWAKNFEKIWNFDYKKIKKDFENFLEKKMHHYKQGRDIPALEGTSKLSPYLHFGMISPRQVFEMAKKTSSKENLEGKIQFIAELGWREFCHHLLFHFPNLPQKNFRPEFDNFPWQENHQDLKKWQKGQTGYPVVDAGMRELWATGWMHNRVRMIVGSFLIKDLLIDWREGEKWFWDCLLDADLASNCASWQWVAGSGADAAPYFRIFNPTLQGERFDPEGDYVRKWVPEIAKLPNRFIHEPWKADAKTLEYCKIELGKTYPKPIVDHGKARDMALMAFKTLKSNSF